MTFLVQVNRDQEVIDTIQRAVSERKIGNASITLIGAVQEVTISVMDKRNAKNDYLREYDQPFELTGTGEVADGQVHLHVTLGGEDVVVAGHLHNAMVRDFFVRAYITGLTE